MYATGGQEAGAGDSDGEVSVVASPAPACRPSPWCGLRPPEGGVINGTDLGSSRVDVGLSSGATTLEFRNAPRDVTARTSSGSISIGVPPGQHYRVEGGSSFAKPDIAAGLQDDTSDRRIEVHTSSGSVKVRYATR